MPVRTVNYQPVALKDEIDFIDEYRREDEALVECVGNELKTRGKRVVAISDYFKDSKYIDLFEYLYKNLGLFYSIAPNFFPKKIICSYEVNPSVRAMIELYYERMGLKDSLPVFEKIVKGRIGDDDDKCWFKDLNDNLDKNKIVVSLSGGKDSVYALVRMIEKYEKDNVLVVYVDNIMGVCPEMERGAVDAVCKKLDVKHKTIKIKNSYKKHRGILNGSEISFSTGLIVPVAIDFGASKIVLGALQCEDDIYTVPAPTFSETIPVINLFNDFLKSIGLDIIAESGVEDSRTPLVYLMENYPEIISECTSCMMLSGFLKSHKLRASKNYSGFPFYERMCCVCPKCMTINIYRLKYDKSMKDLLRSKAVYKYCRRVFKSIALERSCFKVDIIDEVESIVDDIIYEYESDI